VGVKFVWELIIIALSLWFNEEKVCWAVGNKSRLESVWRLGFVRKLQEKVLSLCEGSRGESVRCGYTRLRKETSETVRLWRLFLWRTIRLDVDSSFKVMDVRCEKAVFRLGSFLVSPT